MATVEVAEAQCVPGRLADRGGARRTWRLSLPETPHADAEGEQRKAEHRREQAHHQAMRKHAVEVAAERRVPERALARRTEREEQRQACGERERDDQAVALVGGTERARPRVARIGLAPAPAPSRAAR
jgi:hypothetical protein